MNRVKTRRTHTLQILLFITDSAQREIQGFENKKKEREKFSFVVLVFLVIIRVGENKKFVVFFLLPMMMRMNRSIEGHSHCC